MNMEIEKLQDHIDQVRDIIFEAWHAGIRGEDEMELFSDELKKKIMNDYNFVYDNLGWFGKPSEYIEYEEDGDED